MAENGDAAGAAEALKRIGEIVRSFGTTRRLDDEPAHHAKMLDRLAEPEPER